MSGTCCTHWIAVGLGLYLFVAGQTLAADVYKGSAKFTSAKGDRVSLPVTISIDQATPDTERAALAEKARVNPASAKALLASQKQIGYIEANDKRVPIRYAYVSPAGDGKMMTVLSDEALGYIGGDKKSAKPKEGFDLTYAMLQMNAAGHGRGEMAPASKVKWMECWGTRGRGLRQAGRLA